MKLRSSLIILLILLLCVGISSVMTGSLENSNQPGKLLAFLWGIGMISLLALILYSLSHAMERNVPPKRNIVYDNEGNASRIFGILRETNIRKQAEEELKESWNKYKRQLELSSDSIIVHNEGKIVFANNSILKLIEAKSLDQIIGRSTLDFVHPNYKDITINEIQKVFDEEEKVVLFEEKFIKLNGYVIDVEITAILINYFGNPSIQIIVRDITERKRNEEMHLKFTKALENSGEAIFMTDGDGILSYANPTFSALYGYASEEIPGKLISQVIKNEHSESQDFEMSWKTLLNGQEVKRELTIKRKDGSIIETEGSFSTIHDEMNHIIGFLGIQHDITKQKQIERELLTANKELVLLKEEKEKRADELILAKAHAEESDRLKSAFLANMSHEIRTPMNGILGFADLLKEPDFTGEEQQEYISIIEKSGTRMLNIIDNIVDISKIESGQMKVSISETNINEKIEYIYSRFKPEVERKGMQLFFKNTLTDKAATIKTDGEKIFAILTNLIKNAVKFTNQGYIEIGYEKKGKFLEFYVKDTGTGVRPEQKEFIFERFRQGSDLLTRTYEGAGLGLSISKAFVKMLGGNIWVESEEGNGSIFYFTIPYNVELKEKNVVNSCFA